MSRYVPRWELAGVDGAVVAIDVIRAFTTAAYAFGAGAAEIYLVSSVAEALAFKAATPGVLAMGEESGRRPEGFDLSNSPAVAARADLAGATIVQRTSAGTQGVVNAIDAGELWCASLVCASATARAVGAAPTYVITGWHPDRDRNIGDEDLACAEFIEALRVGRPCDAVAVASRVASSAEALHTLALGPDHVDPTDIELAIAVDRFDFAMKVERTPHGLRMRPH